MSATETQIKAHDLLEMYRLAKRKREEWVEERRLVIEQQADILFGDVIDASRLALRDAEKAVEAEADAKARVATDGKYPAGTKLYEWSRSQWGGPRQKTGRVGIYECVTLDSKFPASMEHRPHIGQWIVRVMKKDGTPSLVTDRWATSWCPEGKKP